MTNKKQLSDDQANLVRDFVYNEMITFGTYIGMSRRVMKDGEARLDIRIHNPCSGEILEFDIVIVSPGHFYVDAPNPDLLDYFGECYDAIVDGLSKGYNKIKGRLLGE